MPLEQKLQPLPYARPMEKENRPPMYCLIWTVIVASGLIFLGAMASAAFLVLLIRTGAQFLSFIPFLVAVVFFYIGIRSLLTAIRFLQGKPAPEGDWERWIFWIWVWRM